MTNHFIVGLDIGTTKIVAIAGKLNEHGKLEILAMGKSDSLGVRRGVVANIDKTVASISQAVTRATEQSDIEMNIAYVGIAGQHIKSLQHRGVLVRKDMETEISRSDIEELKEQMHRLSLPPGDRIIHVLPQEFIVDEEQGIKDPVGMAGIRLEANFHMITGQVTAAKNIHKCVTRAGIEVEDLILEPLASAEAVLSIEEMDAGVALVDIGGGTTDIAIFQDGVIRHTAVIPFGGDIITQDIKEGCLIMSDQAEQLKIEFGCAVAEQTSAHEVVAIPRLRGREPKEISVRTLASIIQARVEEILEQVKFEIESSGFEKKLIAGIVLTGGGSQLKHIVQLAEYVTGLDARIGYPDEHLVKSEIEDINHPMYATAIGLLLKGAQNEQPLSNTNKSVEQLPSHSTNIKEKHKEDRKAKVSWFKNLFSQEKIKGWFEDEEFTDFE